MSTEEKIKTLNYLIKKHPDKLFLLDILKNYQEV